MRPDAARRGESGDAVVEFIGMLAVVILPLVYLVMSLATVQATTFAAEAGAREAARVLSRDPGAGARARDQIDLAFDDYGLPAPESARWSCEPVDCSGTDARIRVEVRAHAALPLAPRWLGWRGVVPVEATSETPAEGMHLVE